MSGSVVSHHSVRLTVPIDATVDEWLEKFATFDQWGLLTKGAVRIQPPGGGWLGYTIWVEWTETW